MGSLGEHSYPHDILRVWGLLSVRVLHRVTISQHKDDVWEFRVSTKGHQPMIIHLHLPGVTTIAPESTGSYWQTLFNALQKAGFDVLLVGGSQTKNVQGRKTDVIDCLWIQKFHSLGLLAGRFLLSDTLQEFRTYYYHRQHLIEQLRVLLVIGPSVGRKALL